MRWLTRRERLMLAAAMAVHEDVERTLEADR